MDASGNPLSLMEQVSNTAGEKPCTMFVQEMLPGRAGAAGIITFTGGRRKDVFGNASWIAANSANSAIWLLTVSQLLFRFCVGACVCAYFRHFCALRCSSHSADGGIKNTRGKKEKHIVFAGTV